MSEEQGGQHGQGGSVLVTGASGFIGGRLAEVLAHGGTRVTGSGRNFPEEASLRAAGVEVVRADLQDRAAMARLCEGRQVVYHVAAWLMQRGKGGEDEARAINVDATRALAEVAAAAGVRRLVLVSSVAVYGLPATDQIDETVSLDVAQKDVYGRTKAQGELQALEVAARTGLELAIVRPAMVYGPRSSGWTVAMFKLVRKGVPVLFGDASGYAFPVYVDDVVDMLRRCGTMPEARGEAFNASDASVTWTQFFAYYGRMCGRAPRRVPLPLARGLAYANEWLHLGLPLNVERLRYYVRRLEVRTEKAQRLLGWRVQVPIDEGMRRSEEWLRRSGLM